MLSLFKKGLAKRQADVILAVVFSDAAVQVMCMDSHDIWAASALPEGAVAARQLLDKKACADALLDALQVLYSLGVSRDAKLSAITALPDDAVMAQQISLAPQLSDHDIEELLVLSAERYIDQPLDAVYYDFRVLSHAPMTEIQLTVAHRSAVDDIIEVLALAGVEALAVDVMSQALARGVRFSQLNSADATDTMICQLGAEYSHLITTKADGSVSHQPLLTGLAALNDAPLATPISTIPTADLSVNPTVNHHADAITHQGTILSLANAQPSHTPKSLDLVRPVLPVEKPVESTVDNSDYFVDKLVNKSVDKPVDNTAIEDKQAIHDSAITRLASRLVEMLAGADADADNQPARLILTGADMPCLIQLTDAINDAGAIHALAAMPLHSDTLHPHSTSLPAYQTQATDLLAVYGLACVFDDTLPALNLLPWRSDQTLQAGERFKRKLIYTAASALALLLMVYGAIFWQLSSTQAINDEISRRIDANQAKIAEMSNIQSQMQGAAAQLSAIDKLGDDTVMTHWQTLATLVPAGVYLNQLSIKPSVSTDEPTPDKLSHAVTISGDADAPAGVASFASQLTAAGYQEVLVTALSEHGSGVGFSLNALQPSMAAADSHRQAQALDDAGGAP